MRAFGGVFGRLGASAGVSSLWSVEWRPIRSDLGPDSRWQLVFSVSTRFLGARRAFPRHSGPENCAWHRENRARPRTTGDRRPATGDRQPVTGDRRPSDRQRSGTEHRPTTGDQRPAQDGRSTCRLPEDGETPTHYARHATGSGLARLGSMRILACFSGVARATKAPATPSSPTVPVIMGIGSTLPSASMWSVSRNSSGV